MTQQQAQDNVVMLRRFFHDQGFAVEETANGIKLKLDSGHLVDIYALLRDSDAFWASVETQSANAKERRREMEMIKSTLSTGLAGIADIGEFKETQTLHNRFVHVATLEIYNAVAYHGMIILGDEPLTESQEASRLKETVRMETPAAPEKTESPSSASDLDQVIEKLESVDGKMLRQALDMMNLKRSSTVRLALMRIFRSTASEEELIRTVKAEAGRIVLPEDRDELEMIRLLSAHGFLEPVVALLYREVFRGRKSGEKI